MIKMDDAMPVCEELNQESMRKNAELLRHHSHGNGKRISNLGISVPGGEMSEMGEDIEDPGCIEGD